MIILNNLWNETFSRNDGWMNQQRSVNDRTTHSYFVVPAWLFLISQQFENLEAGPETQVLAIVTLPISRCLSRWRKKEPSTFDVSDCGVTEPVPLVQRSLHSFVSQLFEKEKKGGKKRRGRERRKKKKRKEERKKILLFDTFNRFETMVKWRVLLKIVASKRGERKRSICNSPFFWVIGESASGTVIVSWPRVKSILIRLYNYRLGSLD